MLQIVQAFELELDQILFKYFEIYDIEALVLLLLFVHCTLVED
jgi:hypothetical protein